MFVWTESLILKSLGFAGCVMVAAKLICAVYATATHGYGVAKM